jgi:hypothetical protein
MRNRGGWNRWYAQTTVNQPFLVRVAHALNASRACWIMTACSILLVTGAVTAWQAALLDKIIFCLGQARRSNKLNDELIKR